VSAFSWLRRLVRREPPVVHQQITTLYVDGKALAKAVNAWNGRDGEGRGR
jgi:hypothetical protein